MVFSTHFQDFFFIHRSKNCLSVALVVEIVVQKKEEEEGEKEGEKGENAR